MIWLESMLPAILVVIGDQVSKAIVLSRWSAPAATARPPFVSIRCILNRRGGLGPFVGVRVLLAVWAAAVVLAALLLVYGMLGHGALASVGVGAAIGGATGNVFDRLCRGAIIDFIAVGPWPVFNLADAAIVAGIGLVLISFR
jgi:signal peptidase II